MNRKLSIRRWLRYSWIGHLPVAGRLFGRRPARPAVPTGKRPQFPVLHPELDQYEPRFLPNDITGMAQRAVFGSGIVLLGESLLSPPALLGDGLPADDASGPAPWSPAPRVAGGLTPEFLSADRTPAVTPPAEVSAVGEPTGAPTPSGGQADTPSNGPGVMGDAEDALRDPLAGDGATRPAAARAAGGAIAGAAQGTPLGADAGGLTPAAPASLPGGAAPAALAPTDGGPVQAPGAAAPSRGRRLAHSTPPAAGGGASGGANSSGGTGSGPLRPSGPQDPGGGLTQGGDGSTLSPTYGQPPLPFEANLGQTDPSVRFLSHGPGYQFFLTGDGAATLVVTRPGQDDTQGPLAQDILRFSFPGSAPAPALAGQDEQPGRSNYFLSNDPTQWLTDVPQYGQVAEPNAYPGIDLAWHGNAQHELEYDFAVAPGADPSPMVLHLDGATALALDGQGDLLIGTAGSTLVQLPPVVSQPGPGGLRTQVVSSTVLLGGNDIGFQLGSYNPALPLLIDPVVAYASYLGGSGDDKAFAAAADGAGDLYAAGVSTSLNFPTTTGVYQTTSSGTAFFVSKVNAAGNALAYSTYLGATNASVSTYLGLAVDVAGNAYLTGVTTATGFPVTAGALQTAFPFGGLGQAGFVSKLGVAGDALLYSTFFGIQGTNPRAVAVDPLGDAYLTGQTPRNFPTTGAFQTSLGTAQQGGFVSELNPGGTALVYSSYLAGTSNADAGYGIAVDGPGNAFIGGVTGSSNFPTTAGAYQTAFPGPQAGFVTEVAAGGGSLKY
jgi:hypothetical protein